ncbi:hypothetical protein I8748_07680 [Nostoc sp. CENA67]|uniref:Uncharacterized protein n=1 Tax=Amazonocrinis nigriterrae CENA67 TaxID=2794033 RepID=A0A8J7HQX4_9NOST|nr:hypothetical protein [Amazonocrinis nigriterrae]MBH8562053.1 hypothetical protein [Amazonocrinis nigriterrae CENA67]
MTLIMIEPHSVAELIKAPIPDAPQGKQPVRLIDSGAAKSVNGILHSLHVLGFAEVGEWTPPLPSPVNGEVIRILTRYMNIDS